jgi:P-type Ca2+ transporter type 2C
MNLFSNLNLVIVVAVSLVFQIWSHHNALLAKFLKTSLLSLNDCLMLLAISAVPLLALEIMKVVRNKSRR